MKGSLRSRSRFFGLALVAVFALCAMLATTASATPTKEKTLEIGDSLGFGYSQQLLNEHLLEGDPAAFFTKGYADDYQTLHKAKFEGNQLVNLACPGETTDSLIGNEPLGKALDPTENEAPCAYHNVTHLPLHVEYGAGKSQLEAALAQIGIAAGEGHPVTKVLFNIGANDELRSIGKCKAEVKAEFEAEGKSKYGGGPEEAVKHCIEAHVTSLFEHILHNIGTIITVLRHGSSFGSVNYGGPILFVSNYDPYGNVYLTQEEVNAANALPQFNNEARLGELLPGSNALAGLLAFHEKKLLEDEGTEALEEGHEPFHGCFANMQNNGLAIQYQFNPPVLKHEAGATGNLQKYTNMNNQTVTKYPGEVIPPRPNGPDIHPTPVGYSRMAKAITLQCG